MQLQSIFCHWSDIYLFTALIATGVYNKQDARMNSICAENIYNKIRGYRVLAKKIIYEILKNIYLNDV